MQVKFEDLPQEVKDNLQHEIDSIGDTQKPENLYRNIVSSTGTTGMIADLFVVPFGLVLKLREINNLI